MITYCVKHAGCEAKGSTQHYSAYTNDEESESSNKGRLSGGRGFFVSQL
jgi:hypothetical protein